MNEQQTSARNPLILIDRIAILICGLSACSSTVLLIFVIYFSSLNELFNKFSTIIQFLAPAALLVVSVFFLRSPSERRILGSINLILFAVGIGTFEFYLARPEVMESRIADAISLDIKFDQRLPKDVVFDGIKNGKRLTLPAFPHDFFSARLEIEGYSFLPFSNPNNSRVVLCNELGEFVTRQTDELGFYNPPGTWKDTSAIDVLLIGDSYTAGWCVPEGNSLADIVRASFKRTINIGRGGLGPLGELASMREYLPAIRPKFAVWAFFDNDFGNLHDEERHINLYNQYLIDDSFSQNLFENSGKINTAVTQYINIEIGKLNQRKNLPFVGIRHQIHGISDMIKNAKVTKAHWSSKREFPHHIALFRQIMESAKREAQKAETTLIFAYLSDYKPFKESKELKAFTKLRREVLRVVKELKIDFIDTNIAANMATKNVRSLHRWTKEYPTSLPSNVVRHYNSFGHQVVGLEIVRKLQSEFNLMHKGNK